MPITLHPITRREFLARSLAAAAAAMVAPKMFGATTPTDPHRFALLADTHINADPGTVDRETNMTENLTCIAAELAGLDVLPAAAFVVGDLAHKSGENGDYATFVKVIEPVRAAGVPVHLTLGNHDERGRFWKAIPPQDVPVEDRHVAVVKSARANFFILDSLDKTNGVPGLCGEKQLRWLAGALDAHADKPAITMVHHQPDQRKEVSGLIDTEALWEVIGPRRQVKMHVFGHTHDWNIASREGLHLVNLPPTAYVFAKTRPSGWVECRLERDGARLELHSIEPNHSEARKPVVLEWR